MAPDWLEPPGYAPVVVACEAENDQSQTFAVAISETKDRLFVYTGARSAAIEFDFSDGKLHHVALAGLSGELNVLIDAQLVARLDFGFAPTTAGTLCAGGLSQSDSLFRGAIGQLRIWDVMLAPKELVDYSMADEEAEIAPHPSLSGLRVRSDFRREGLRLIPVEKVALEGERE